MALATLGGSRRVLRSSFRTRLSTKASTKRLVASHRWRAAPYATKAKEVECNDKLSSEISTTTSSINPAILTVVGSERTPYWQMIPQIFVAGECSSYILLEAARLTALRLETSSKAKTDLFDSSKKSFQNAFLHQRTPKQCSSISRHETTFSEMLKKASGWRQWPSD